MWPRMLEFMFGCWMAMSAFIFRYPSDADFFWYNDLACGALILLFSLTSFYHRLRKMHLCNLAVALYLIALSYFFTLSVPFENYMIIGLFLFIVSLIPSPANEPSESWQQFYKDQ